MENAFSHGLLWKIDTAGNAVEPSYLLGTLTSADPRVHALPQGLVKALSRMKSAVFEGLSTNQKMPETRLGSDESLFDLLNENQKKKLTELAPLYGMDPNDMSNLKPVTLFTMFSYPPSELARQSQGNEPLDLALEWQLREQGVPVFGLETEDEIAARYDNLPYPLQAELLGSVLQNAETKETEFEHLLQLYLAQDLAGMKAAWDKAIASLQTATREFYETSFLTRRNNLFTERMKEHLNNGGAFIAVGASHLLGETGVLNLLHSKNYRLTRVD
ncbi:TraB/GumN family protein [Pelagibius sp. Alg239-R121]|uniref:TraB/GumN family protein n=1 Tax=Pelagibius sp. Alg239-R121 TaxID=2993448 RepID=UPI0024A7A2EB|nr:TraB/GumN family protein [Pelagibius sp. Alg239-R121]